MVAAVIGIDPTHVKGRGFQNFVEVIRFFQAKGLLARAYIGSIQHASQYPLPLEFYSESKDRYAKESHAAIQFVCDGRFDFESVRILHSNSPVAEDHVQRLSQYAKSLRADLIVVGSSGRKGIPYWFLGSFSETAALTSKLPVLIIKSQAVVSEFAEAPRLVFSVDAAALPSTKAIQWIADFARSAGAFLDIVYVIPVKKPLVDGLESRRSQKDTDKTLRGVQALLASRGVKSDITILDEEVSVAHTIENFSEKRKAWIIITAAVKRTRPRKLLLGSRARRILSITKRPFLSVRLG